MNTRILALLALVVVPGASATSSAADDPKLPDVKTFDKLVIDALRDAHNKGAELYNTANDFPGAYRLYQGALVTVRPLLAHRPAAQKLIDDGLSAADKEKTVDRKAFVLHEAIEAVRKNLKDAIGPTKPDDKKPDDKKPDDKKPEDKKKPDDKKLDDKKPEDKKPDDKKAEDKKPDDKKPDDKKPEPVAVASKLKERAPAVASASGKITVGGQPPTEAEVTFVSLTQPLPRVFTAKVNADGTYKCTEAIPPGKYAVIVTGKNVPAKYHLVTTSGLVVEFAAGANTHDFALQ
jgi:hypothetical protein